MSAGKRFLIALCLLGCAGLFVLTMLRVADRGRFARPFSSYGSGTQGTRALFLLLSELGHPVMRWSQDLARLPDRATLIALGSCESLLARPLSRFEQSELLGWIDRGGVLIVAGARNYLPDTIGVHFHDDADCQGAHRDDDASVAAPPVPASAPTPSGPAAPPAAVGGDPELAKAISDLLPFAGKPDTREPDGSLWAVPMGTGLEGLPIVRFRKPGQLRFESRLSAQRLLGVPPAPDAGPIELLPLAIEFRRGQGRVVVLSAANMLQNAELDSSEGATLFMRLIRSYANAGPLIFDEYHLGLGERRSLMQYLRQLGAMPLVFQLLLVAFVALRRAGARLGGVPAAATVRPVGTISFVTALGGLYTKVGDRAAALRLIARAALARLARHHALGNVQPAALERELERRGAVRAAAAVRTIVAAGSSTKTEPIEVSVGRIDQALAAAMAEGRRTTPR